MSLVVFSFILTGCNKTDDDKDKTTSTTDFNQRAKDVRKQTVLEHTYDPHNLVIADSLYEESEKVNSDYGKAIACQIRTYVYIADKTKTKEFLEASDELLKLTKGQKDKGFKATYYDGLTTRVYFLINQKKYMTAQGVVQEALDAAGKADDHQGLYYSNNLMGVIYTNRGNRKIAIPYLEKALHYTDSDSINICCVARDIATNYVSMNNYKKALEYANMCKRYARTDLYDVWAEYTIFNIYFEAGRDAECLREYNGSILSNDEAVQGVLPDHTQLYLKACVAACSKDWDKAISLAKKIGIEDETQPLLLQIFKRKGDYKNALEAKESIDERNEKLQGDMLISDLSEMETRMGVTHLKTEAEKSVQEKKQMLYLSIAVIVAAIFIVTTIVVIFISRRRAARQREKVMEEREVFYRNMTHQLRTPMTVVLGMINQMKYHIKRNEKIDMETVDAAERQSNNLLLLIKQLIDASKKGKLREALTSAQGDIISAQNAIQQAGGEDTKSSTPLSKSAFAAFSVHGTHSILVAEDNDDVALLICNMLHDQGYGVKRACDGQEAWELLQDELHDLLLTDIAMPRMDGLELMRHVREDETMSHLPIIVVSARVEDHERLEGISAGAEVYLAKPFINEELILRVRKLIEQREQLRKSFTVSAAPSETLTENIADNSTKVEIKIPEVMNDIPDDIRKEAESDKSKETDEDKEKRFMDDINKLIDDNMKSGDVTTQFLADGMYLSVSTLNRKMKNITGMTSTIYIRARRLSVAKYLLENTEKSVTEIELLCGFNTIGYFARLFKAEEGVSPSEYRLQHRHELLSEQ